MAFGHLRRSLPSGSVLTLCLMAAFADGEKHEREREQIRRIAESFRGSEVDLSALYQEVLLRNRRRLVDAYSPDVSGTLFACLNARSHFPFRSIHPFE